MVGWIISSRLGPETDPVYKDGTQWLCSSRRSDREAFKMDSYPWLEHYDLHVPKHLDYPEIPLFRDLQDSAESHPDKACTLFKGGSISYAEMDRLTDELAAGLVDLGVVKGQPVGIFMPNIPQFVLAFYAILKAGGVVTAFNPLYTPHELEHQMKDSGVEIMFVMSSFYPKVNAARGEPSFATAL